MRMKPDVVQSVNWKTDRLSFRSYTTARGDLMLDIYKNLKVIYTFGPFDNREQRQVFLHKMGIIQHRYYKMSLQTQE